MRRRFMRLSSSEQAIIYGLRIAARMSFREIEKHVGASKSTIQYNMDLITEKFETSSKEQDSIKQLVYFVLSSIFVGKGSARGTASMTSLLFVSGISHVTVLKILDCAAEVADKLNSELKLDLIKVAIFDEVFKKKCPILAMADPITGLIYLKNTPDRSSKEWIAFLEELKGQGLDIENATTDGGAALLSALEKVFPKCVKIRDFFHVLYKMSKALKRIECKCHNLILRVDKAEDEEKKVVLSEKCELAMSIHCDLEKEISIFAASAYIQKPEGCGQYIYAEELGKIVDNCVAYLNYFISEIGDHKAIREAKNYLQNGKEDILAYKRLVEKKVQDQFGKVYSKLYLDFFMQLVEAMDQYQRSYESTKRSDYWGNRAAHLINKSKDYIGDEATLLGINQAWDIFKSTVKCNSYIEAVNSVIRPHLDTHNKIPRWLCPILTFYWNNRVFQRGKRKATSPIASFLDKTEIDNKTWIERIMDHFPFERFNKGIDFTDFSLAA